MRHEIGEGENVKKQEKKVAGRRSSGAELPDQLTDTLPDEIDPADFFDPEEFGYRRARSHGS
jgi:hypothetical protein